MLHLPDGRSRKILKSFKAFLSLKKRVFKYLNSFFFFKKGRAIPKIAAGKLDALLSK